MLVARSLSELSSLPGADRPAVVSIGNFDGVHVGHQAVLATVRERASAGDARSVVVTFDPHPSHVLRGEDLPRTQLITPLPEKLRILAATGIDVTLVLPFNEELRTLSARQFAKQILCDALHAVEVHEVETFRFGHRAEADMQGLQTLGQELCFRVQAYRPVIRRGAAVSSTRVRETIRAGNVELARCLLGRCFTLASTPAKGRGYGTRYAVPTINLATPLELLPGHGVYVTTLRIGDDDRSIVFQGVTNAGNRPTFGADSYAIETHLFDFVPVDVSENTPLELTFLHRLRGEQRFESPEALKAQIAKDVQRAQRYFDLCRRVAS